MRGVILTLFVFSLLIPLSYADISSDITAFSDKIQDFIGGGEIVVVEGKYASSAEKAAFSLIQSKYPDFQAEIIKEEDLLPEDIKNKTLILLGGPTQNYIAKEALNDASFTSEKESITLGSIEFLEGEKGKVMIFSDATGYENEPKKLSKSPLAKVMPESVIPIAATGISLGLIWLWKLLAEWTYRIFRFKIADKIMGKVKKKQIKEKFKGIKIKGIRLKVREWVSIAISAIVFGASLSYIYLSPGSGAFTIVALTILANIVMYAIRHITRLIMDNRYKIHTEFHIWYWGALITAVSGWLGNAFCVAGYIVSNESKEKEAFIAYVVNLITFFLFIIFFVWNLINPGLIVQMVMILCISYTLLQLLPIAPFPGKGIYKWKKGLWWVTFVPVGIFYTLITLVI